VVQRQRQRLPVRRHAPAPVAPRHLQPVVHPPGRRRRAERQEQRHCQRPRSTRAKSHRR
jgi:hypothetical protein